MSRFDRRTMLKTTALAGLVPTIATLEQAAAWGQPAAEEPPVADCPPPTDLYGDAVLCKRDPPAIGEESFTIAVLPDTQYYDGANAGIFGKQTAWIVENREKYNIACVFHLGDITNNNHAGQWQNAQATMRRLDGVVPYFMVAGNHDYGNGGDGEDRNSDFSTYFPVCHYSSNPTWGGVYPAEPERIDNSYHLFTAGGVDYIVMALEFGPRKEVVKWAADVLKTHPDRQGILITHAYMYHSDDRYHWARYCRHQNWNPHSYGLAENYGHNVCDGEELWNLLVKDQPNLFMTLNGHVLCDGLGRTTSQNEAGKDCHQMLVNFQMRPQGGDGWMRLVEVANPSKTLKVIDYSPTRGECNLSPENHFELKLS